jgi:hypothetical protein
MLPGEFGNGFKNPEKGGNSRDSLYLTFAGGSAGSAMVLCLTFPNS